MKKRGVFELVMVETSMVVIGPGVATRASLLSSWRTLTRSPTTESSVRSSGFGDHRGNYPSRRLEQARGSTHSPRRDHFGVSALSALGAFEFDKTVVGDELRRDEHAVAGQDRAEAMEVARVLLRPGAKEIVVLISRIDPDHGKPGFLHRAVHRRCAKRRARSAED